MAEEIDDADFTAIPNRRNMQRGDTLYVNPDCINLTSGDRGRINLGSKVARELIAISKYIEILYSSKYEAIRLRPVDETYPGAFKIQAGGLGLVSKSLVLPAALKKARPLRGLYAPMPAHEFTWQAMTKSSQDKQERKH